MKELENGRLYEIGCRILRAAGNELYVRMRFLDVALSGFVFQMDSEVKTAGTDGLFIYFNVRDLGGLYREDRIEVNRLYLHMVLHCIFQHMLKKGRREKELFSLACDIVIESVIDSLDLRKVNRLYLHMVLHCIFQHMLKKGRREKELFSLACDIVIESVIDSLDLRNVRRLYLHMVLHCIFQHMLKKGRREKELFSLACDIVIESVIDSLDLRNVRRGWSSLRRETYRHMEQKMRVLTAEKVYRELEHINLTEIELL